MNADKWHESDGGWDHIGQAAQAFARRVARDAGRFAERLEEHTGEFARELSHEWRRARRRHRRAARGSEADVRQVFEDVRIVLGDILDGVDEFIAKVFRDPFEAERTQTTESAQSEPEWTRIVSNRVTTCAACGRTVETGEEGFFRHNPDGIAFRCLDCGAPTHETETS